MFVCVFVLCIRLICRSVFFHIFLIALNKYLYLKEEEEEGDEEEEEENFEIYLTIFFKINYFLNVSISYV